MNEIEQEKDFRSQVFLSIDRWKLLGVRLPFLERETGLSKISKTKEI
jgi:hypothetical protein